MDNHYEAIHFKLYELVDPNVYAAYGNMAWKFLDKNCLMAIDTLRALFGPLTVNDWKWGGKFQWSGLRTSASGYSELSAHYRGCAFDVKSKSFTGEQMRMSLKLYEAYLTFGGDLSEIKYNMLIKMFFDFINEIEEDTSFWLHVARVNREELRYIPNPNN